MSFPLADSREWHVPLRLRLDLTGEAVMFLNGKMMGRHPGRTPWRQSWAATEEDYYLPEPYLNYGGRNEVALAARSTNPRAGLRSAALLSYAEHCVRRARLVIEARVGT